MYTVHDGSAIPRRVIHDPIESQSPSHALARPPVSTVRRLCRARVSRTRVLRGQKSYVPPDIRLLAITKHECMLFSPKCRKTNFSPCLMGSCCYYYSAARLHPHVAVLDRFVGDVGQRVLFIQGVVCAVTPRHLQDVVSLAADPVLPRKSPELARYVSKSIGLIR